MQILRFYLALFLFMIFQNLIYGLFIFEIKDQNFLLDFFIFPEFKLGLIKKKKKIRFMDKVRVCKFVLRGFKTIFFKILYI